MSLVVRRLQIVPDGAAEHRFDVGHDESLDLDKAFRSYSRLVAAIALRILGRHEDVEDLVQDVFVEAGRWLSRIQNPPAFKYWLVKVTVRAAQRRLRRRRLRSRLGFDTPSDYLDVCDDNASAAERELMASLYQVLDSLPVKERVPWTLRYLQGESLVRVAELCDCSIATAKRRIAGAHRVVTEALSDE